MNVDKVKVKCVARLQCTVGYVGAFLTRGGVIYPWTTELLHLSSSLIGKNNNLANVPERFFH